MATDVFINPKSLVTYKELEVILGMKSSKIRELVKKKRFPAPKALHSKQGKVAKRYWVYSDILDWLKHKDEGKVYSDEGKMTHPQCFWGERQSLRMRKIRKRETVGRRSTTYGDPIEDN